MVESHTINKPLDSLGAQAQHGVTELEPPVTDLITLPRHILSQQYQLGEKATGDLTMLLIAIQVSRSWGISRSNAETSR